MKPAVPAFRFELLAVIAACLAFVCPANAARQSNDAITTIMTAGQWRYSQMGQMMTGVFNADGSFTYSVTASVAMPGTPAAAGSPAAQQAGSWEITSDKVIVKFPDDQNDIEIYLPVNERFVRGVDRRGVPVMMLKMAPAPAPGGPGATPQQVIPGFPSAPIPLVAPTPSPTPAASADEQHSAAQVIQDHHNSLVFVNGKEGAGSGFVATIGNGTFLVTNVHVVAEIRDAAFKSLDGAAAQPGPASMAVGEDILCMSVPKTGKPFDVMQSVDTNAAIGDTVVVLGNAEGAGVVNTIIGHIVGIGPDLIETDAPFVPGNSGSPIVHLKTGKVIAVATYTITNQYDLTTDKKLKDPVVRRFGYRLDSVKNWQPVNWQAFAAQAAQMKGIETLTDDLYDFFRDLDEHHNGITPERHTNPILKNRIDEWLEAKGHNHSIQDRIEADANLISFLKVSCQSDIASAQRQITYDYFRRELDDQSQTRGEMGKAFEEILKDMDR